MLQNAGDQIVEVKTDAAPTHEVANCSPKLKVAPASAVWEPCVVLRTNESTYDVQIICDVDVCKDVPKRFVRELRVSKSQLWCPAKVKSLRAVMQQVRKEICEGAVMPKGYMKRASELLRSMYPGIKPKQIAGRWNREVNCGRELAVVSKINDPLLPVDNETLTTIPTLTTGRTWSEAERSVVLDILTGFMWCCVLFVKCIRLHLVCVFVYTQATKDC